MTRPRILLIVIGRPDTLRIAVAPNATMIAGTHNRTLIVQPPVATTDLVGIGALVQTPFAARLELEMLYRIGDKYQLAINFGVFECPYKHAARRTNKGLSLFILLIAGLFAHQHDPRSRRAFTRNDLCRILVKWATRAFFFGTRSALNDLIGNAFTQGSLRRGNDVGTKPVPLEVLPDPAGLHILVPVTDISIAQAHGRQAYRGRSRQARIPLHSEYAARLHIVQIKMALGGDVTRTDTVSMGMSALAH